MEIKSLGILPSKKLYSTNNCLTHVKSLCLQIRALILLASTTGRISASIFLSLPVPVQSYSQWEMERRTPEVSLLSSHKGKHWLTAKERKNNTNPNPTEIGGHLEGMRGHSLTMNFLYSSYSNKIPNALSLHLQFIKFFSDGQLVAKDLFHGTRWVRKSFFVFRKKPSLLLNYFLQHG